MKLNTKIVTLLVLSSCFIVLLLSVVYTFSLRSNQQQNIGLFKEEFAELSRESFGNDSTLFYYNLDNRLQSSTHSAQTIMGIVADVDPQATNVFVVNISDLKFLYGQQDSDFASLVNKQVLNRYVQENILNETNDFDIDNYDSFLSDTTGQKVPSQLHIKIYSDLGVIVGYGKTFVTSRVRIQYIQEKNDQLFYLYLAIFTGIAMALLISLVTIMIFLMRNVVIRPLTLLTQGAKQLGKGNLDVAVEVKSKDEIGELAIVFNQMAGQIKGYYGELENKVKERTQALEKAKTDLEHSLSDATSLQQVIKEERDRARAIVSSMGEGLFVIDKDMKIILMNPTGEKLFEVSGQQVIGRSIVDMVPHILKDGQELPEPDRPTSKTLAGASMLIGVDDNYSVRLPSGHGFPIALATTPLRGEGGVITGVVMVFRDITSEKQSRSAIEQQVIERTKELQDKNTALVAAKEEISRGWLQIQMEKARLLASVNSISLGFLMLDATGKTLIKNPAVEKAIGIKSDYADIDSIDQQLGKAFSIKEKFNKCIEERTTVNDNNVNFNNKYFRLFMAPIFSTDNTLSVIGVVILIQDETEAKVLDRSKDEFFSIASHELRTPLTAIRGNTSLIEQYFGEKLKAEPELNEMINDIHESSIRLINIVNDFLNVSRLEQGKMEYKIENFDLPTLIDKKIEEISSLSVEKHIPIVFKRPAAPLPAAYSDKDRTGEVLLNLLGNALKYSEKGTINVETVLLQGYIKISVTDTGKGIAPEQQSLLFRKFQQAGKSIMTRDTTRATGLGLYISKLLTEQMGGQIFLEKSVPGVGSTFSFTIPVQQVGGVQAILNYAGGGTGQA